MFQPAIHIDTSGWSYNHWKDLFYPKGLRQKDWLQYYADRFNCVEINGSFYRLPSVETVELWIAAVADDFIFCPKMSRYLSHMKKLCNPEEPLQRFFTVFESMRRKLGPVLIQLPPGLKFYKEVAEYFFLQLKTHYSNYEVVLEIRDDSWLNSESLDLLNVNNIGLVISQSGNLFPYSEMITATNIYFRFHGPKELYASSYSTQMLEAFATKFIDWKNEGHAIWAFFNNDIYGYAVEDAQRLKAIIKKWSSNTAPSNKRIKQ
ncbi:MAG: DUF72 domain-containing protein [Chitinophagaceae bacterium]